MISLRAMEPDDLDLLYKVENDQELWEVGATNVPYSKALLRDFIMNATGDIYTDKQVRLIVEDDFGNVVGLADLVNFNPRHLRAEVGIVVLKNYRNQGIATEVLAKLTSYASDFLHLRQLYACIDAGNEVSLRLFKKSGFIESGTLHQWLRAKEGYHKAILMQYLCVNNC